MFVAFILTLISSITLTYIALKWLIPRLKKRGLVGRDLHKSGKVMVAEMGGIAVVFSFTITILAALFIQTFFYTSEPLNVNYTLITLLVFLILSFTGLVDDLLSLSKTVKLLLPFLGAIPIIALKVAGSTAITIPFIGVIDLGLLYFFVVIPLAISASANLTNICAGYNGVEYGMAIPMFMALVLLGVATHNVTMLIISSTMLGASFLFFLFSYPTAKIFPGDTGTLPIGGVIATLLILFNSESFALIFAPYLIDAVIKIWNHLPSKGWQAKLKDGKLHSPKRPIGYFHLLLKIFGPMREQNLVALAIGIESFVSFIVLAFFALRGGWL